MEIKIAEARLQLEEKGWAVVPDVIPEQLSIELAGEVKQYMQNMMPSGDWPPMHKSLVHGYRASHLRAAWECRVRSIPVFSALWGTDQLFSSTDAVAIARPPEDGVEPFGSAEDAGWLHVDQGSRRQGLHCYQGGVYLEPCSTEDYCLRVLEGSHKRMQDFWEFFPDAAKQSSIDYHKLSEEQICWFQELGCSVRRIEVPRGGLVLWDSRTAHDNAAPQRSRAHARWRCICFVAMTPAAWASERDVREKREAYKNMWTTGHWPSVGVRILDGDDEVDPRLRRLAELPEVARTQLARRLAALDEYESCDTERSGPPKPIMLE